MDELKFVNSNFEFIPSIKININELELINLEIFGSHQRTPKEWVSIPYVKNIKNECYEFIKPLNYAHFLLKNTGSRIEKKQVLFNALPKLTRNEVIAYLKTKKIKFLSCARDCEEKIQDSLNLMKKIGVFFADYKIFVLENDSKDNTYNLLLNNNNNINLQVIKLYGLDVIFPHRTDRLAYCRNTLLDESYLYYSDFTCVMDVDGVVESRSIDGILTSFFYHECWDGVFPANEDRYYDLWAFRHPQLMPEDFFIRVNKIDYSCEAIDPLGLIGRSIYKSDFSKLQGWLEVDSAFGGLAVYKTKSMLGARYKGRISNNDVCEHVSFHNDMRNLSGAKLYINPKMVVLGQKIASLE